MHKVIDLFAGAGGLSLGFKQTGKYEIAAAFEINQNAQKTYKKNHSGTEVFSDVCSADFAKLRNSERLMLLLEGLLVRAFQWLTDRRIML